MFQHEVQIRVRYGETDRMGYCYYGNYAQYFEVARVEALRELGITYKTLEDSGIALPVSKYNIRYLLPAYYDELLTIQVRIIELPSSRIKFEYRTTNEKGDLINTAYTELFFLETVRKKPVRVPDSILKVLSHYFK